MDLEAEDKIQQLKKDYYQLERIHEDEKGCLTKIINTYGVLVSMHPDTADGVRAIKNFLDSEESLPLARIEEEIGKLKDKIIGKEHDESVSVEGALEQLKAVKERLIGACRTVKRIMIPVLEDFYPTSAELSAKAQAIEIKCADDVSMIDLEKPTNDFLRYVEGLKTKISEDFRYINSSFLSLLEHVKELEKTLTNEFGMDERLKEIEYFEMKVSHEVGSIVESFNIHRTISEIKSTVIDKIENIKRLVAIKKEQEVKRSKSAQKKIKKLSKRMIQAERDARTMSKKAERFQTAAMRDGLTGLFNRKAIDMKVKEALQTFHSEKKPLSLMIFDIDGFKMINDTFGHVAGDTVLKKVAQCLGETFRKGDFIARYGGDEFVVAVDNLTREMARERILGFRKNLKKRRFVSYEKGEINLTVSTGLALAREGDTVESLIERADRAMYASKTTKAEAVS